MKKENVTTEFHARYAKRGDLYISRIPFAHKMLFTTTMYITSNPGTKEMDDLSIGWLVGHTLTLRTVMVTIHLYVVTKEKPKSGHECYYSALSLITSSSILLLKSDKIQTRPRGFLKTRGSLFVPHYHHQNQRHFPL